MKFIMVILLALSMVLSNLPTTYAADKPADLEPLPQVRGEGAYLLDVQSGQTLFSKNPDEQLAPASTTKIMTGLLALERGNLNDVVTVSPTMLNSKLVYGTQIYLEPGEKLSLQDLLYAMLLNSANDAAVTVAEHIGGDVQSFVDLMNQRAQEIGATQTHFVNPSGLTEQGHVTTAHDLALIARVAYQNPLFAQYVRTKSHSISRSKSDLPTQMVNENKMLWQNSDVDGIKTGYTAAAENCLVASMTKDGRQLIGVILKSPGREIYTDMQNLFDYGYTNYSDKILKPAGSVLSSIMVNNEPVDLKIDRPIYLTQSLADQTPSSLTLKVTPSTVKLTSVQEDQEVARVEIYDGSTLLDTLPLRAAQTIMPPSPVKNSNPNYHSWLVGIIPVGALSLLLLRWKIDVDRRSRKRILLARRRESN
ncbi:D-alanyl-D-alanine carboxypeptidase family protein [Desulfosporosinus sp. PR]|uniref:D-alanyl-D-alanine carboxypeptidase family protein n=1 Tax=Candidatus Desulfosporosinus nitrosoreducens TaxID=3401928 RepID=UPI0027FDE86F|nr:D-alanyl-D-alanine carboxypeptidase family protein [Desulfosporosinus sp. PR]MDQ7092714.1 D-alanyl-D-alanine carboxypeptidase family protein [Desulfosporosinus sp. PR]